MTLLANVKVLLYSYLLTGTGTVTSTVTLTGQGTTITTYTVGCIMMVTTLTITETGTETGTDRHDLLAADVVESLGIRTEAYPALWGIHGKSAGPLRNTQMLETGIDHCLAFLSKPLFQSKGTQDMVRKCIAAKVPTQLFEL